LKFLQPFKSINGASAGLFSDTKFKFELKTHQPSKSIKMEIVSKISEPKLVWNIFMYVAEAPLTKEKRKQIEEWRCLWSETGEYGLFPKFVDYCLTDIAFDFEDAKDNTGYLERTKISLQLKLFENQEYDWTQPTSEYIDDWLFDMWDIEKNGSGFLFHIELAARRSVDVGVKLQLDYDIIPLRYLGIAEAKYTKEYNWYLELERGV